MSARLDERVGRAAEAALAAQHHVSVLDVLTGMGLLAASNVKSWQQGRVEYLGEFIQGSPEKIGSALTILRDWAAAKGLEAAEAQYVRATRNGPVELRIFPGLDPAVDRAFRTRYIAATLSPAKREKLQEKLAKAPEIAVFQILRDSGCSECGVEIPKGELLLMEKEQPLCMACAGLGDLEFLPSGDATLTRRATKYSGRKAVVVRFSRSRGRYERQGILLEPQAIERAEVDCIDDADQRAVIRQRAAMARSEDGKVLTARMAREIRNLFPGCPPQEAAEIAAHSAIRGSGRVGRSAAGRELREDALTMAVIAAIRHRHTNYDELLMTGLDRSIARERVAGSVAAVLDSWRRGAVMSGAGGK